VASTQAQMSDARGLYPWRAVPAASSHGRLLAVSAAFTAVLVSLPVVGQEAPEPGASVAAGRNQDVLHWEGDGGRELTITGWVAADGLSFPQTEAGFGPSQQTTFRLAAARVSARFEQSQHLRGKLDAELSGQSPEAAEAWVEYAPVSWLGARAGRFKVPFGLAQQLNTPERRLMDAPMLAGNPKDFQDVGFGLFGRVPGDWVEYGVATVTGSRDIAVDVNDTPDVAGRLVVRPMAPLGPWLSGLSLGGSGVLGRSPTAHGFRGRTLAGYTFADPPTVRGDQLKWGAEVCWTMPRLQLLAEYQSLALSREGITASQKLTSGLSTVEGLSDYEVSGWYAEAAWHFWGESSGTTPVNGIEVAARFESLDFGDGSRKVKAASSPSDKPEFENRGPLPDGWSEALTVGLTGYFGPHLRVTAAWQGIRFSHASFAPDHPEVSTPGSGPAGDWVQQFFLRTMLLF